MQLPQNIRDQIIAIIFYQDTSERRDEIIFPYLTRMRFTNI